MTAASTATASEGKTAAAATAATAAAGATASSSASSSSSSSSSSEQKVAAAAASPADAFILSKGDLCIYTSASGRVVVRIVGVHKDPAGGPTYYTVALPDGREKQTTIEKLEVASDGKPLLVSLEIAPHFSVDFRLHSKVLEASRGGGGSGSGGGGGAEGKEGAGAGAAAGEVKTDDPGGGGAVGAAFESVVAALVSATGIHIDAACASSTLAMHPGESAAELDAAMRGFYGQFNKEKLNDKNFVPKVLSKYAGREAVLFAELREKYQANPVKIAFMYEVPSSSSGANKRGSGGGEGAAAGGATAADEDGGGKKRGSGKSKWRWASCVEDLLVHAGDMLIKEKRLRARLCAPDDDVKEAEVASKKEKVRERRASKLAQQQGKAGGGGGAAAAAAADAEPPWLGKWSGELVLKGWLKKKGNQRGTWKRRWFEVGRGHRVTYYDDSPSTDGRGGGGKARTTFQLTPDSTCHHNAVNGKGKNARGFTVLAQPISDGTGGGVAGAMRPYVLEGESDAQQEKWIRTLQAVIDNVAWDVSKAGGRAGKDVIDLLDQIPARKKADAERSSRNKQPAAASAAGAAGAGGAANGATGRADPIPCAAELALARPDALLPFARSEEVVQRLLKAGMRAPAGVVRAEAVSSAYGRLDKALTSATSKRLVTKLLDGAASDAAADAKGGERGQATATSADPFSTALGSGGDISHKRHRPMPWVIAWSPPGIPLRIPEPRFTCGYPCAPFVPTYSYQDVCPCQSIPPGLEVRLGVANCSATGLLLLLLLLLLLCVNPSVSCNKSLTPYCTQFDARMRANTPETLAALRAACRSKCPWVAGKLTNVRESCLPGHSRCGSRILSANISEWMSNARRWSTTSARRLQARRNRRAVPLSRARVRISWSRTRIRALTDRRALKNRSFSCCRTTGTST